MNFNYPIRTKILLFLMFAFLLSIFNSTISGTISLWQTQLFFDHIITYFADFNVYTINGELMSGWIGNLEDLRGTFVGYQNNYNLSLIASVVMSVLFIIAYSKNREIINARELKFAFDLRNDVKYPLFISLFFAVGLSFYFSTTLIESSMIETTIIILSNIQPFTDSRVPLDDESAKIVMDEAFGGKSSLIGTLLVDKTAAFVESSFTQIYFFGLVIFLLFGTLSIYVGSRFFADAFFVSSLVGLVIWIFQTLLHSIS